MRYNSYQLLDWLVTKKYERCGLVLNYVELEHYKIEYWSSNKPLPTLILLHAFGAECKYSWLKQIRQFSKHFNLVIPNLVFFGNSTMEAPTYKIADQVIGLSLLLRKLNIDTFSLGASSYGGVIASELILKGNFTINKLFLTNTPIKFSDPNDWDEILIDFGVSKKSDILIPRNAQQLKKIFQLSFYRKRYIPLFVFKKIYSQLYTKQANQRRLLVDSFVEEQIIFRDKEYRISCPVLLIWGKNDLLAPLIIGEKLVQYLGNKSQLIVFDRTGHMPNLEKSKKFNSMVLKFLLDD